MFKGYQKLMVLKELSKSDLSGYSLMKRLEELSGKKPSPGYIYPLLKELTDSNYVSKKSDGRKNIYSILKKGRTLLKDMQANHDELQSLSTRLSSINKNLGPDQKKILSFITKNFDAHRTKLILDAPLILRFMRARMLVFKSDFKTKKKQYKKIILDAAKELEELAKK
jgi:formylmethanofuran dehydrogenase subunit E